LERSVQGNPAKGGAIMKTAIIVALVLIAIAGAVVGVRYLQDTSQADYEPAPAMTNEERNFVRKAHEMLETAIFLDEEAAKRAHLPAVREFASKSATDHRNMRDQLASAVRSLDSDFVFNSRSNNRSLEDPDGIAYDGDYLQDVITRHQEVRTTIEQVPSTRQNATMVRFVSLWQADASGHSSEARQLLMDLPDTASNLTLLLLAGMASLTLAALIMVHKNFVSRRAALANDRDQRQFH
jgi:predicted outer membrane protein